MLLSLNLNMNRKFLPGTRNPNRSLKKVDGLCVFKDASFTCCQVLSSNEVGDSYCDQICQMLDNIRYGNLDSDRGQIFFQSD